MNRFFSALGACVLAAAAGGCCMVEEMKLQEQQPANISGIVNQHRQNINCKKELDILCGKAWVPVYIEGQDSKDGKESISVPKNVQPYIEFCRDGVVRGFAGVNNFSGNFAVGAPNTLRFGALAISQKPGSHLDYEMLFKAQLNDADNFVLLKNGEIELRKRNALMLRCKPVSLSSVKQRGAAPVKNSGKGNAADNPAMPTVGGK
jgi:heat shock protein HslJ